MPALLQAFQFQAPSTILAKNQERHFYFKNRECLPGAAKIPPA